MYIKSLLFYFWLCWVFVAMLGMKPNHCLILYIRINSKHIKDLNVRSETIKFPDKNIGSKLLDMGLDDDFF